MKLRNKKTGETVYVDFQIPLCNNNEVLGAYSVTSLKELNERFEDYTTQEPLIKEENIRKIVRDWAKVNAIDRVQYIIFNHPRSYRFEYNSCDDNFAIDLVGWIPELKREGLYTITELCGGGING